MKSKQPMERPTKNLVITQFAGYLAFTTTIVIVGVPITIMIERATGQKLVFIQQFLIMFVGVLLGMIVKTHTVRFFGRINAQRTSQEMNLSEERIERLFASFWVQICAVVVCGAFAGVVIALLNSIYA